MRLSLPSQSAVPPKNTFETQVVFVVRLEAGFCHKNSCVDVVERSRLPLDDNNTSQMRVNKLIKSFFAWRNETISLFRENLFDEKRLNRSAERAANSTAELNHTTTWHDINNQPYIVTRSSCVRNFPDGLIREKKLSRRKFCVCRCTCTTDNS